VAGAVGGQASAGHTTTKAKQQRGPTVGDGVQSASEAEAIDSGVG
jgi:hypothetical protein